MDEVSEDGFDDISDEPSWPVVDEEGQRDYDAIIEKLKIRHALE
jgi:hypothetical protein